MAVGCDLIGNFAKFGKSMSDMDYIAYSAGAPRGLAATLLYEKPSRIPLP